MNMKKPTKRLCLLVSLVLLCSLILPLLGSCDENEEQTTTTEEVTTAASSKTTKDNAGKKTDDGIDYMQSTPNKGGSTRLTSGGLPVKSSYSAYLEELRKKTANLVQTKANNVAERRSLAEGTMRTMLTLRWSPAQDTSYSLSKTGGTDYTLRADRVYAGVPYTYAAAGLEAFLYLTSSAKDDGTLVIGVTQDLLSGSSTYTRVGSDMVDTLIQAWNKVSASVYVRSVDDMIPANGVLPVGTWQIPQASGSGSSSDPSTEFPVGQGGEAQNNLYSDGSLNGDTDDICLYNGEQTMYAAYALLQKGDALIRNTSGSDAMMAVSVSVVKNADGTIDGAASTVTVLRQTISNFTGEVKSGDVYVIGDVDKVFTFQDLYTNGHIPVTVKELCDGSELDAEVSIRDSIASDAYTKANIYKGYISSTRRVAMVNITITDPAGTEVANSTHLAVQSDLRVGTERRYGFDIAKLTGTGETGRYFGKMAATSDFVSGTEYHYVLTMTLVTGEVITARDFTFKG